MEACLFYGRPENLLIVVAVWGGKRLHYETGFPRLHRSVGSHSSDSSSLLLGRSDFRGDIKNAYLVTVFLEEFSLLQGFEEYTLEISKIVLWYMECIDNRVAKECFVSSGMFSPR